MPDTIRLLLGKTPLGSCRLRLLLTKSALDPRKSSCRDLPWLHLINQSVLPSEFDVLTASSNVRLTSRALVQLGDSTAFAVTIIVEASNDVHRRLEKCKFMRIIKI